MLEARTRSEKHQLDTDRLSREVADAEAGVKSATIPVNKAKADVEQAEAVLRNLNKEGGAQRSGYHEKMPALLRALQQEKSFTVPPVGPIGNHITLLKPEWSSILENSLGGTLNSFIVTSKRDMNILTNVMQRVNWLVSISLTLSYVLCSNHLEVCVPSSSEAMVTLIHRSMNLILSSIQRCVSCRLVPPCVPKT